MPNIIMMAILALMFYFGKVHGAGFTPNFIARTDMAITPKPNNNGIYFLAT
jgi:hypothetical protein